MGLRAVGSTRRRHKVGRESREEREREPGRKNIFSRRTKNQTPAPAVCTRKSWKKYISISPPISLPFYGGHYTPFFGVVGFLEFSLFSLKSVRRRATNAAFAALRRGLPQPEIVYFKATPVQNLRPPHSAASRLEGIPAATAAGEASTTVRSAKTTKADSGPRPPGGRSIKKHQPSLYTITPPTFLMYPFGKVEAFGKLFPPSVRSLHSNACSIRARGETRLLTFAD